MITSKPDSTLSVIANPLVHLPIIADAVDYCVIDKPAGAVVHQSAIHPEPDTVVNGLLALYPALATVGDDPIRPGIVQRLDQIVSGVMVIAKTPAMFEYLKQQFQNHTIVKQYIGLAHGQFSQAVGEINFSITRSSKNYTKMAARPDTSGKPATTHYTVRQRYQHYTLLELRIVTGRTHQIRVHLNAIGHPLVGETVYVPKRFHSRLQPSQLFLHAQFLSFTQLDGQTVTYTAPLPLELQGILDGFRPLPYDKQAKN